MRTKKNKELRKEPYRRNGVIYERLYEIVSYPDSTNYLNSEKVLSRLEGVNCKYVFIYHDKCLDSQGELKKNHLHLLLKFDREKSIKSVARLFGVHEENVKWKADIQLSVQYLVHFRNPEKHRYPISDLKSNMDLSIYFPDSECEIVNNIVDYAIRNGANRYQVMSYCLNYDYWGYYRKNYSIIWDIIEEFRSQSPMFKESYLTKII